MEKIICLSLFVLTIIALKLVFKISYKKAKALDNYKGLEKITDRFPENVQIAKEMLEMLGNTGVKIEEQKDTTTSLYVAVTNKMFLADMKNNYSRIQTIAHECLHSVQDKTLLMFNFIFSNITIIYFLIAVVLTICKVYTNHLLQVFILLLMALIQLAIRGFLETDAMTKSKYLAKEYIENKHLCTKEEIHDLIKQYDTINNIGIPFYLYIIITKALLKISLYIIIAVFC